MPLKEHEEGDLQSFSVAIESGKLSTEEVGFGVREPHEFEPTPNLYPDVVGTEPPPRSPTPTGCCRLTVSDGDISGTLHICDTDVTLPPHGPMSCTDESVDDFCPSCNSGMSCTATSPISDTSHTCPDGANMTGNVSIAVGIQCHGAGIGWTINVTAFGTVDCPCRPHPGPLLGFTDVHEEVVMDPEDLAGTWMFSGDFSGDGQPGLTWSVTVVIERTAACRCPCRFMTIDASVVWTNCVGFFGSFSWSVVVDWELAFCCGQGGLVTACHEEQDPVHSFSLGVCISRPGNCNFVDNPWHLHLECLDPVCSCGGPIEQDLPTPPDGTYMVTDGASEWTITISCSDTA